MPIVSGLLVDNVSVKMCYFIVELHIIGVCCIAILLTSLLTRCQVNQAKCRNALRAEFTYHPDEEEKRKTFNDMM